MKNKKLNLLLSKVDVSKKDAFLKDITDSKPDERESVIAKYGIKLTEEEKAFLLSRSAMELSEDNLDRIAGGFVDCDLETSEYTTTTSESC